MLLVNTIAMLFKVIVGKMLMLNKMNNHLILKFLLI